MASENIKKLEEALRTDEALRAKYAETVAAIKAEGKALSDSELAAEAATRLGYPVTAEELDRSRADGQALNDEELDAVSGGAKVPFGDGTWCWSHDYCVVFDNHHIPDEWCTTNNEVCTSAYQSGKSGWYDGFQE